MRLFPLALTFCCFAVSACSTFPSCETVRDSNLWQPASWSSKTREARKAAEDGHFFDRGVSWGAEYWFVDGQGNLLLCADECPDNNEALGIDIRYEVQFRNTGASWNYEVRPEPMCTPRSMNHLQD